MKCSFIFDKSSKTLPIMTEWHTISIRVQSPRLVCMPYKTIFPAKSQKLQHHSSHIHVSKLFLERVYRNDRQNETLK